MTEESKPDLPALAAERSRRAKILNDYWYARGQDWSQAELYRIMDWYVEAAAPWEAAVREKNKPQD